MHEGTRYEPTGGHDLASLCLFDLSRLGLFQKSSLVTWKLD